MCAYETRNHLQRVETIWNKLEPRETRWNQQQTDIKKQEINRKKFRGVDTVCAILLPNTKQHYQ